MNNWKYKIDVLSLGVFEEIEENYGINFPNELREFFIKHNATTPEKYHFMVGTTERVFGAVLSVNKGEVDTDSIYVALDSITDKNIIPFAIDPFGNYICYDSSNGKTMYWDHETNITKSTGLSLPEFIDSLY